MNALPLVDDPIVFRMYGYFAPGRLLRNFFNLQNPRPHHHHHHHQSSSTHPVGIKKEINWSQERGLRKHFASPTFSPELGKPCANTIHVCSVVIRRLQWSG